MDEKGDSGGKDGGESSSLEIGNIHYIFIMNINTKYLFLNYYDHLLEFPFLLKKAKTT